MRIIDAGALIAEMHNVILEDGEDRRTFYKVIERQPTIDAITVVRCKNCKHYHTHDRRCKVWNHGVGREEFCSRGEWKDDPSHPFADDVMMG